MLQLNKKKDPTVTVLSKRTNPPSGNIIASTSDDVQYTKRNVDYNNIIKKSGFLGSETEGIKVDKSGNTTAKPFSRKVITNGNTTRIIGDDGTVIKEGPSNRRDVEDAVRQSQKHVDQTNALRERNKRVNDLFGRKATDITDREVDMLNQEKHATGNPKDPKLLKAEADENNRIALTQKHVDEREKLKSDAKAKEDAKKREAHARTEKKFADSKIKVKIRK